MPSAKILEKKKVECAELTEKIQNAVAGVLVSYTGITVEQDTQLRKALREAGVDYSVYKNSVVRFAVADSRFADFTKHLDGTTAVALTEGDMTAPARIIAKYAKENKEGFNIKAGFVEEELLDEAGVQNLANIPSKEVLIAQVLGGLNGVIRNFAVVLDQIREQKEAC